MEISAVALRRDLGKIQVLVQTADGTWRLAIDVPSPTPLPLLFVREASQVEAAPNVEL